MVVVVAEFESEAAGPFVDAILGVLVKSKLLKSEAAKE